LTGGTHADQRLGCPHNEQGRPHAPLQNASEKPAFAFDADTLGQLWHVSVLGSNETPSDSRNCGQVSPEIGITSTPVIICNADRGSMYLVSIGPAGNWSLAPKP